MNVLACCRSSFDFVSLENCHNDHVLMNLLSEDGREKLEFLLVDFTAV